ncbi:MAG: ABC transporter permease [Pseudobdellovibrionaceae bacterium]
MSARKIRKTEITREDKGDTIVFLLSGDLTIENAPRLVKQLEPLHTRLGKADHIDIVAKDIAHLDTTGAYLLAEIVGSFHETGLKVRFEGFSDQHEQLLRSVFDAYDDLVKGQEQRTAKPSLSLIGQLGKKSVVFYNELLSALDFLGRVCVGLVSLPFSPSRFKGASVVRHMYEAGFQALPIVMAMAFLIAIVLAYQGVVQLKNFGAEVYTVNLTAISILREMGVILTAIMVAGRSGSAYAAEIGVMKLNEEIDAMKTMGLNPMDILVLPRIIALILVLPLLTFFADMAGLFGGAVSIAMLIDLPFERFIGQMKQGITIWTYLTGMIKAPVFGLLIAFVGTHSGMSASGSAESVGRMTTASVVKAIFLVILADALFSILFVKLGI